MFCKIEFNELSEALVSVNDSYAFEPNIWYAIDGTTVEFECRPGYEFEVHSVRTCLHNSSWDVEATIYREIGFTSGVPQSPIYALPMLSIVGIIVISVI
ncbi:unnamed protein product, partial [Oppiella nova]